MHPLRLRQIIPAIREVQRAAGLSKGEWVTRISFSGLSSWQLQLRISLIDLNNRFFNLQSRNANSGKRNSVALRIALGKTASRALLCLHWTMEGLALPRRNQGVAKENSNLKVLQKCNT
jgi:hypothetical protein